MNHAQADLWTRLLAARSDPSDATRDRAACAVLAGDSGLPAIEKLVFLHHVDDAYAVADKIGLDAFEGAELLLSSVLAPLRADPRFMTLTARQGVVAIWLQTDRWPDFCEDGSLPYDCRVEARRAVSPQARSLETGSGAVAGQKQS